MKRNRLSNSSSGWSITRGAFVARLQQQRKKKTHPLSAGKVVQLPVASVVHPELQYVTIGATNRGKMALFRPG